MLTIRLSKVGTVVVIWLLAAVIHALLEYGVLGDLTHYPATGNPFDLRTSLVTYSLAVTAYGVLLAIVEVFWLSDRFRAESFGKKILFKAAIYIATLVAAVWVTGLLVNSFRIGQPPWSPAALAEFYAFAGNFAFTATMLYYGAVTVGTLFLLDISDNLGQGVLRNFIMGTYHRPVDEERIFMFLDLTSSTTTAEELGHVRYFAFLNDYFRDLTTPILAAHGVIYQYVGDEVVVSWERPQGLADGRCIRCFYDCMITIEGRAEYYRQTYGVMPAFKAGMHLGGATVGEIGSIKKEIVYSGDALNTGARIQSLCGTYGEDLLISGDLAEALREAGQPVDQREIAEVTLRGRQRPVKLFTVGAP